MNCPNCGAPIEDGKCMYCGTSVQPPPIAVQPQKVASVESPLINNINIVNQVIPEIENVSPKSKLAAFLLCFFLGYFGIHYFYAGKMGMGILYFLTLGIFGIGWVVDIIRILTGHFTDNKGRYISRG